jgi:hypothetical protein
VVFPLITSMHRMVRFYFRHNSSHSPRPSATFLVSRGDLTALGSLIPSFPWTLSRNSPSLLVLHQCAREWFDWTELDLGLFRTRGRQWISLGQVAIYLLWLSQGRFGTEWSPLDPAGMNIGQGFDISDLCLLGFESLAVSVQGQILVRFGVGLWN